MKQENNNLVFFATGEMYNKQCVYAILSLLNIYNKNLPDWMSIYIYTNQPEVYSFLPKTFEVFLIPVNDKKLEEWKLGGDLFLTTKISLIKEFLNEHSGNMLFVDTDVIFKRKLESTFKKISSGKYVLHLREEKLSSPGNRHFLNIFADKIFTLNSGRVISINSQREMWNTGLIGISSKEKGIVEDALELCFKLMEHSSSRLLEQLAFSLVFQDTGKLVSDELKLVHYWWRKSSFNPVIKEVIDKKYKDLTTLLDEAERMDPTNRTLAHRFFYDLHPNGFLRKSIVKAAIMLK